MAVACEWSITRWIANHLIFAPGSWDADLMISSLTLVAVAVVVVVVVVVVVLKNCPPPFWNSLSALPLSALGLWLVCATILCHLCTLPLLCAWSAVGLRHYPIVHCHWSALGLRLVCATTLCVHCHWFALGLWLVCATILWLPLVCATILSAPCATILCARRHLVSARFVPAYLVVLFLMINVKFMLAAPLIVLWLLWLASKLAPVTKGFWKLTKPIAP